MGAFYILFLGIKNGMSRECLHSQGLEPSACKALSSTLMGCVLEIKKWKLQGSNL